MSGGFPLVRLRAALALLLLLPLTADAAVPSDDDAGTGRDAPHKPAGAPEVLARALHQGRIVSTLDTGDVFALHGAAGRHVSLRATDCAVLVDERARILTDDCDLQLDGTYVIEGDIAPDGQAYVKFTARGAYRFVFGLDAAPAGLVRPPTVSDTRIVSDCAGLPAAERDATSGAGDPAVPTLAWAALKTGFRAVVVWTTDSPTTAILWAGVEGEALQRFTELAPRRSHAFVLDDMPVGGVLCLRAGHAGAQGEWHALRLRNAMTAFDDGAYTANLFVLANEAPHAPDLVLAQLSSFARRLWDATDGHVRAGSIVVLFAEADHVHSGLVTCHMALSVVEADTPTCDAVFDIVYTNDNVPYSPGATWMDGIQDERAGIYLHPALLTVPLPTGAPEYDLAEQGGFVLVHEFGHYAFGMDDLHAGTGCINRKLDLSIMGDIHVRTEFDDAVARCPNEPSLAGYVPSWERLRARFQQIPARLSGPDAGPFGDGGALDLHAFDALR